MLVPLEQEQSLCKCGHIYRWHSGFGGPCIDCMNEGKHEGHGLCMEFTEKESLENVS